MTHERNCIQENANKYIVKNCPAMFYSGITDEAKCWQKWEQFDESCQNCTDCVIKQVIEKCKERSGKCEKCKASEDYQPTDCLDYCSNDDVIFANNILQLFDIEEINK